MTFGFVWMTESVSREMPKFKEKRSTPTQLVGLAYAGDICLGSEK